MDDMTCWKNEIEHEMGCCGDTWADVEACTLTEEELLEQFDSGWGCTEGKAFTVWTKNRVYFPAQYDGSEWCDSVARNPNGSATFHIGGG